MIEKTGSDKIYIPYARGVEVEYLKKYISRIDYNGIKSKELIIWLIYTIEV